MDEVHKKILEEQTELLRNMWNEMKALNSKIDKVNENLGAKIDQTNERLDALDTSLSARIDATNERLVKVEAKLESIDNRLGGVESAVKEVTIQHRWLNSFVSNVFTDEITQIKERLARVEAHQEAH